MLPPNSHESYTEPPRKVAERLWVPDLSDIVTRSGYAGSQVRAALRWAEAGWCLLPTDNYGFTDRRTGEYVPTIKRPGSLVGKKWYKYSTRDPEQIIEWWGHWWPWAGIALDCGASGAVVFDADVPDLAVIELDGRADIAGALRTAEGRMPTRLAGDRGHYPFMLQRDDNGTLAEVYGDTAGAFGIYGEVRCYHGVVIAALTPHADADKGGHYGFKPGRVTPLPDVLRECLGWNGNANAAPPLTDTELDEFLRAHGHYGNTTKLMWVVRKFHERVDNGESRHRTLITCLSWAFEEARCGHYPAALALQELGEAFMCRFDGTTARKRRAPSSAEVLEAAKWAASNALSVDPVERVKRRAAARKRGAA
jgi:hypothetical protein